MKSRITSNTGLMGKTHAMSALALALVTLAFSLETITRMLGTTSVIVLVSYILIVTGYAMFPDFDNTQSTAIHSFGIIGKVISSLLRSLGVFIYHLTRAKADDKDPDPHRLFWHTPVAGVLVGLIVTVTSSMTYTFTLNSFPIRLGFVLAMVWIYIGIKLAFSGILGAKIKKYKKTSTLFSAIYEPALLLLSLVVAYFSPKDIGYTWVGVSASIGYLTHLLGDFITVKGIPLLFPLKIKGKRWRDERVVGIKAGGEIEESILFPILTLLVVLCTAKIAYDLIGGTLYV